MKVSLKKFSPVVTRFQRQKGKKKVAFDLVGVDDNAMTDDGNEAKNEVVPDVLPDNPTDSVKTKPVVSKSKRKNGSKNESKKTKNK